MQNKMGFDVLDKQNQDFHSVLVCSSTSIVLEVGSTVILLFVQDDIDLIIVIKCFQSYRYYLVIM